MTKRVHTLVSHHAHTSCITQGRPQEKRRRKRKLTNQT
jgi:hypothetical protein